MEEETFRRVCRSLEWVEQGAVFTWAPSWRNADMTDLELVRLARPEALRGVREDQCASRTSAGPDGLLPAAVTWPFPAG
jgi:hypothetical protein